MYFDEPWSRPGDYILMKALKDLVCVTSACPCDIDAANGWNPTDIQLRIYPATNSFNKATAFRMTTHADTQLTRETGFHKRTSEHTRNFTEYEGYWLANSYTQYGVLDEYWACRERAAVIDLSALRKYEVTGPDAELLMQTCVTRDIRRLSPGQVVYTAMCYENGGMIDDGTVFRLGQNNFRWIGGSDESGIWLREQAEKLGLKAWVRNSTDQLHNLQIQGPKSRDILKEVIWTRPDQANIDELGWFRFSIARIGNEEGIPILVSRTGYTGELGFEIFCHPKDGANVWDAVWEAGKAYKLAPLGLEALDMLRVEAGLIFAGYEFSDQTDPYEAGISFTVPLKSKEDDFIGRDALVKRKENPQRVLVGLEMVGDEMALNGDCVNIGRNQVGEITSAVKSPILRKNFALARISIEYSEIGTELEIGKLDGKQKRLPAKVVPFPFYDPTKSRVRDVPMPD
jgi:aminomethyltransferase